MRFLTTQEELEALLWICFSLRIILLIFGRKKKVDEKIIKKIDINKKKISEISEISKMSTKLMSKILTFSEFSKIFEKKIRFSSFESFSFFSAWVTTTNFYMEPHTSMQRLRKEFMRDSPRSIFLWSLIHPCLQRRFLLFWSSEWFEDWEQEPFFEQNRSFFTWLGFILI